MVDIKEVGLETFATGLIIRSDSGFFRNSYGVKYYICLTCGVIKSYMNQDDLQKIRERNKK